MLRVEAPGGYSDHFLLEPLGCVNVGECFKQADKKVDKGHYPVRRKKRWNDSRSADQGESRHHHHNR